MFEKRKEHEEVTRRMRLRRGIFFVLAIMGFFYYDNVRYTTDGNRKCLGRMTYRECIVSDKPTVWAALIGASRRFLFNGLTYKMWQRLIYRAAGYREF